MDRKLVVSLHDVASATLARTRELSAALDRAGAAPRVLKVIPNELTDDLAAFLRDEVARGSEIVLHGYTHRADGVARGPAIDRLRARLFARDAAEFLTLDREPMRERLERGRNALARAALESHGFCAPAWLAAPGLDTVLVDLGFRYRVGMASVRDLVRRRTLLTPWIGNAAADPFGEWLLALGGAPTLLAAPLLPVVKVFLHPGRGTDPILRALPALLRHRRVVTYSSLLDG